MWELVIWKKIWLILKAYFVTGKNSFGSGEMIHLLF